MNRGHYIHCLSNASVDVFYNNKLSNFTNVLPRNFNLSSGGEDRAWEIGIAAIGIDLNIADNNYFEVVKITSDIITAEPNEKEPVLYTTSLPVKKKNKYFFKTVNNIQYFPVRNTNLKTVSIKLLDTEDKILPLQDGQPSVVQFHLRKRANEMAFETIHLQVDNLSDVEAHPRNTPDNFSFNLKTPIYLNRGAKIALTDISYPNSVQKLPDSIFDEMHEIDGELDRLPINLNFSTGTDLDPMTLFDYLNRHRDTYSKMLSFGVVAKNSNLDHFQVKFAGGNMGSYRLYILIPGALKRLLGVEGMADIFVDNDNNKTFTAEKPLINLSSIPYLEAADRKIIISMSKKYEKFPLIRATTSTNDANNFALSLNNKLEERVKKYIEFSLRDGYLIITRKSEEDLVNMRVIIRGGTKNILGINLNREIVLPTKGSKFIADRPINLYALYPGIMMCYTNFIQHSMVGSDFYPLFRTIPMADQSNREDEYISVHFDNLEFHKINTSRLDFMHFQFKRINGDFVNFIDNNQKMIVNLTIRNPK